MFRTTVVAGAFTVKSRTQERQELLNPLVILPALEHTPYKAGYPVIV